jgi:hypothetical protein
MFTELLLVLLYISSYSTNEKYLMKINCNIELAAHVIKPGCYALALQYIVWLAEGMLTAPNPKFLTRDTACQDCMND